MSRIQYYFTTPMAVDPKTLNDLPGRCVIPARDRGTNMVVSRAVEVDPTQLAEQARKEFMSLAINMDEPAFLEVAQYVTFVWEPEQRSIPLKFDFASEWPRIKAAGHGLLLRTADSAVKRAMGAMGG